MGYKYKPLHPRFAKPEIEGIRPRELRSNQTSDMHPGTSLVAQMLKSLFAIGETQV